jgi:hypothetical protein
MRFAFISPRFYVIELTKRGALMKISLWYISRFFWVILNCTAKFILFPD